MALDTIVNGDAYKLIDTIPDKSVDLVVTDPPYAYTAKGGAGAFGVAHRGYEFAKVRDVQIVGEKLESGVASIILLLKKMERVCDPYNAYVWCSKTQLPFLLDFALKENLHYDVLVWCKTNPMPADNNRYLSDIEYCVFIREKGVPLYGDYSSKHKYWIIEVNQKDKRLYGHPTIKPLDIIKKLVYNSSRVGQVVFDPFMGSGTTAVAAKELGRHFIGFELDRHWWKVANDRLKGITQEDRNAMSNGQQTLFDIGNLQK